MNQLPLSFCSSIGYKNYMSIVEPNYTPCSEMVKKRLAVLQTTVTEKIKGTLNAVKSD